MAYQKSTDIMASPTKNNKGTKQPTNTSPGVFTTIGNSSRNTKIPREPSISKPNSLMAVHINDLEQELIAQRQARKRNSTDVPRDLEKRILQMLETRVAKVSGMTTPCGKLQREKVVTRVTTEPKTPATSPMQKQAESCSDFQDSGGACEHKNKPPKSKTRPPTGLVREKVTTKKY